MLPTLRRALIALPLLACLTACAPDLRPVNPDIPQSLLVCPSEPVPGPIADDQALASFILDLSDWGWTCKRNLEAVHNILEMQKSR